MNGNQESIEPYQKGNFACGNRNSNNCISLSYQNSDKTKFKNVEKLEKCQRILEPFVHQVSGTAHMLKYDHNTIGKSLSQREWDFYRFMPEGLKPFTPVLKGILHAKLEGNGTSYYFNDTNNNDKLSMTADTQKEPSNLETTLFKGLDRVEYTSLNGFNSHPWTVDKDQEALTEVLGKNPWSLRRHNEEINRVLENANSRTDKIRMHESIGFTKSYLLLDDITKNYHFPSIIDLKIGTQMERYGCSREKQDKHIHLVKKSTTGTLGVRLAGMQVYQVTTGYYLCRDKYYGRGLLTPGFVEAITQFLHDGNKIVVDVIPLIIDRLLALRSELAKLDSYRFYAGSLLLTYEGAVHNTTTANDCNSQSLQIMSAKKRKVGVNMIDFAHSTFKGFMNDENIYDGPDTDCLFALDNLVSVLGDILKEESSII